MMGDITCPPIVCAARGFVVRGALVVSRSHRSLTPSSYSPFWNELIGNCARESSELLLSRLGGMDDDANDADDAAAAHSDGGGGVGGGGGSGGATADADADGGCESTRNPFREMS